MHPLSLPVFEVEPTSFPSLERGWFWHHLAMKLEEWGAVNQLVKFCTYLDRSIVQPYGHIKHQIVEYYPDHTCWLSYKNVFERVSVVRILIWSMSVSYSENKSHRSIAYEQASQENFEFMLLTPKSKAPKLLAPPFRLNEELHNAAL